jgi:transcriptional regulator with XRE-family HTH domain
MEPVKTLEPPEVPIEEVDPREQLGTLVKRLRLRAKLTEDDFASKAQMEASEVKAVESFMMPLDANQIASVAVVLGCGVDGLLDASRSFNRALWAEKNPGVEGYQLTDIDGKATGMSVDDARLSQELIRNADEMLFISNIASDLSIRARDNSKRTRALLVEMGMIPEDSEEDLLADPHVDCAACGVKLNRNTQNVVSFQPDGDGEAVYFGHKECGETLHSGCLDCPYGNKIQPEVE